ncbi:MAG TPA: hypothetical protein VKT80_18430, partial [Chloroflexota bacterium]|nr:hypothetical protein [Chloroflexota bacterium]
MADAINLSSLAKPPTFEEALTGLVRRTPPPKNVDWHPLALLSNKDAPKVRNSSTGRAELRILRESGPLFNQSPDQAASYVLLAADCIDWMQSRDANSIQAIVTDPPYGLKEYSDIEKAKLRSGRGGVWRIPPSFDGCERAPVPRFTVLSDVER